MRAPLRFRPDGTFTILQLTDLHLGRLGDLDRRTIALVEEVLDAERPDLVALTGDLICRCDDPARAFREAVRPIEARALPWAFVFGNHDDEGPLSRAELMAVAREHAHCLAEPGPAALPGVGNYVLQVLARDRDAAAADLIFLDSHAYDPADRGRYAWIAPEQVAWLEAVARPIPTLAFFHIPLPEYDLAWQRGGAKGHKLEAVCCPVVNSGGFDALRDAGVLGVFVGHDHLNDYEAELDGVRLCYGRATGYDTYGRDDFPRGARGIRLREGERGFETWVRTVDGPHPGP